jgi:hypothetical protein
LAASTGQPPTLAQPGEALASPAFLRSGRSIGSAVPSTSTIERPREGVGPGTLEIDPHAMRSLHFHGRAVVRREIGWHPNPIVPRVSAAACLSVSLTRAFEVGPRTRVVPFVMRAGKSIRLPRSRRRCGANSTLALGPTGAPVHEGRPMTKFGHVQWTGSACNFTPRACISFSTVS